MPNYFLGVAGSKELSRSDITEAFWCVPSIATIDDIILLYCPRSVDDKRQGVFAEARISRAPSANDQNNSRCSGYGLLYVPIEVQRRFLSPVTAKDMKSDPVLKTASFIRRNFQGTSFQLQEASYKRILALGEKKKAGT